MPGEEARVSNVCRWSLRSIAWACECEQWVCGMVRQQDLQVFGDLESCKLRMKTHYLFTNMHAYFLGLLWFNFIHILLRCLVDHCWAFRLKLMVLSAMESIVKPFFYIRRQYGPLSLLPGYNCWSCGIEFQGFFSIAQWGLFAQVRSSLVWSVSCFLSSGHTGIKNPL